MTLAVSSVRTGTAETTSSTTRLAFSSSTPMSTHWPYIVMTRKSRMTPIAATT